MKKIFLVLVFLLVAFAAMAQDWIGLDYYVDVGWASSQFGGWTYESPFNLNFPEVPLRSLYTTLGCDIWLWKHLFVGAALTTQIQPNNGTITNWDPTFTDYMFEAGVQFGIVKFVYKHDCSHPINTYQYAYKVTSVWGEGSVDRFYLEIHSSIGSVPK